VTVKFDIGRCCIKIELNRLISFSDGRKPGSEWCRVNDETYLYREIRERIHSSVRNMPAHTRLPSRQALAKQFGVTATTIEKAVSELIGRGVLYSRRGSGTYVAPSAPERTEAGGPPNAEGPRSPVAAWGVLVPDVMDDFYTAIVRGVEDVAERRGTNVILCNTDNDPAKERKYVEQLIRSGAEGVIIVPVISAGEKSAEHYWKLREQGIFFVFCNRGVDGVAAPRVLYDNYAAGYLGTKHLIDQGARRLAYIASPVYLSSEQRYQGFLGALRDAGLPVDEELVLLEEGLGQEEAGYVCGREVLSLDRPPDGVVCFNDTVAAGLYRAAAERGVSIGDELLVIGNGDTAICEKLPVKLSSVGYPKYDTGRIAAEFLVESLEGTPRRRNRTAVLQPELIVRDSTGRI